MEELEEADADEDEVADDEDLLCFLVGGSFCCSLSSDVIDLLQSAMISAIVTP